MGRGDMQHCQPGQWTDISRLLPRGDPHRGGDHCPQDTEHHQRMSYHVEYGLGILGRLCYRQVWPAAHDADIANGNAVSRLPSVDDLQRFVRCRWNPWGRHWRHCLHLCVQSVLCVDLEWDTDWLHGRMYEL